MPLVPAWHSGKGRQWLLPTPRRFPRPGSQCRTRIWFRSSAVNRFICKVAHLMAARHKAVVVHTTQCLATSVTTAANAALRVAAKAAMMDQADVVAAHAEPMAALLLAIRIRFIVLPAGRIASTSMWRRSTCCRKRWHSRRRSLVPVRSARRHASMKTVFAFSRATMTCDTIRCQVFDSIWAFGSKIAFGVSAATHG